MENSIDFDTPSPESIRIDVIAHNLAAMSFGSDVRPGLHRNMAQLSVNIADSLRRDLLPVSTQMSGLLYLASSAYVPQPLAPVLESPLSTQMFSIASVASANIMMVLFRKFSIDERLEPLLAKTAAIEIEADDIGVKRERGGVADWRGPAWGRELAAWQFMATALVLARELSEEAGDIVLGELPNHFTDYRWLLRPSTGAPRGSERGVVQDTHDAMHDMSDDLRRVFVKHGFDPAGPAFAELIAAAEAVDSVAVDDTAAPSTPKPRDVN